MIARISIYIILVVVLADWYIDKQYVRNKQNGKFWKRLLLWLPTSLFCAFTIKMAVIPNFMPDNPSLLYGYLFILGIFILPKICFVGCSWLGMMCKRKFQLYRNWGHWIGLLGALLIIFIVIYGSGVGFRKLQVKHLHLYSKTLPAAFDGYRIVHISDLHVGTYHGSRLSLLQQAIDSVLAQKADIVLFTGDLQNVQPQELNPVQSLLSSLHAKDGVYSVFGNHDYSEYIEASDEVKKANEQELMERQRRMGWQLLMNEHRVIRRGTDSLVIAGTENDGRKPFPSRADLGKALRGVGKEAYVVLLQHDPSSWRNSILPHSHVQLTLSGHTHGGQINLWGLRPTLFSYPEDDGLYEDKGRQLFVTRGLGGTIPLRFGVDREIVVITLHQQK